MASRYPPGQNSSRLYESSYTHSTQPSKSTYPSAHHSTTLHSYSNRHDSPSSFACSPLPPAPEMYLSSMTFSNSSLTAEGDLPDRSHVSSSNNSNRNKSKHDSSPRYQHTPDRGRKKSPRGRKPTPPRPELRPEPHAPHRTCYRSQHKALSFSGSVHHENGDTPHSSNHHEDLGTPHSYNNHDARGTPHRSNHHEKRGTPHRSNREDRDTLHGPNRNDDRGTHHRSNHKSSSNPSKYASSTQRTHFASNSSPGGAFNPSRSTHNKSKKAFSRDSETATPPAKKQAALRTETASKDQCSICLNEVKDKVSLKCEHSFCYECLVKWCATKETCPLCRTKITQLNEMDKSLPNQRMSATFVCACGNKWKSTYAYNGIKQGCKACQREVAASAQHPLRQAPNNVNALLGLFPLMREKESSHKQELCGMCKLLGKDCSRQEAMGDDDDLFDLVGLENLMALFNLSESAMDHGIGEEDWSNPFSDPDDFGFGDLGLDYDSYESLYDYDYDYNADFDVYNLEDLDQIDWDPDWDT